MKYSLAFLFSVLITFSSLNGQKKGTPPAQDSIMISIFLKHQQDKNLEEIQKIQKENHFFEAFPPKFTKVVSWYVMMGIGQVVTLKLPASDLRNLNVIIEKTAWKAFNTEFYPTYDFRPIYEEVRKK